MAQNPSHTRSSTAPAARVKIISLPLWRIRIARELPRYLLCGAAAAGIFASARFAIDPPRQALRRPQPTATASDLAARGFAVLFARRYLTWSAAHPEAHREALEQFVGSGIEVDAGMQLPARGAQQVQWAEVVQEREPAAAEHVYTVAAQTDRAAPLYLTVSILRRPDGRLALAGYPAFVGSPAFGPALLADGHQREVSDEGLMTVVRRGLSNYLASSPTELEADLSGSARVSLPNEELTLEALQRLQWVAGPGAVEAVIQARGQDGAQYTLAYELDVAREGGRWEISAIQMSPEGQ